MPLRPFISALALAAALALPSAAAGHAIRGTIAFTAGATVAPVASSASVAQSDAQSEDGGDDDDEAAWAEPSSTLSVVVRWAGFMALLGMIGAATFHLVVLRRARRMAVMGHVAEGDAAGAPASPHAAGISTVAERASDGAWHLALSAAALSALALLARLWLQSVALNGPADAFDGVALNTLITETVWGAGWALQAMATVAFVVGLMVSRAPHGRSTGWMGAGLAALLLAAVPALSGHASAVEGWPAMAIASDWLHVLGAGAWLGTLAALLLCGLPAATLAPEGERGAAFTVMVGSFSPVALAGAGLAGATGVINSLFHLTAVPQLWETAYGRALLLKLALLAVVAGLGFYNWRYILPNLHAASGPARLRRNAAMELAAGVAVLLATAVLVALPPP